MFCLPTSNGIRRATAGWLMAYVMRRGAERSWAELMSRGGAERGGPPITEVRGASNTTIRPGDVMFVSLPPLATTHSVASEPACTKPHQIAIRSTDADHGLGSTGGRRPGRAGAGRPPRMGAFPGHAMKAPALPALFTERRKKRVRVGGAGLSRPSQQGRYVPSDSLPSRRVQSHLIKGRSALPAHPSYTPSSIFEPPPPRGGLLRPVSNCKLFLLIKPCQGAARR